MLEKSAPAGQNRRRRFPGLFWLVILFEFFERGSYYGMMSVLSVYFTDVLFFPKESVGVIKSVIQPILYFLPIVSGALADRFGYRKALTVAFALLGTGYFLTSQFTTYTYVFLALVVMALGAGTFKPIISGTIARVTDKENSTLGFGIYYWSINLGAFLFPLILVPWLKNSYGWHWVIIAAAIGTGTMLIPMFLFFREPARPTEGAAARASLVQTLANAFEIVFSPVVMVHRLARRSLPAALGVAVGLLAFGAWAVYEYATPPEAEIYVEAVPHTLWGKTLLVAVRRDQSNPADFRLQAAGDNPAQAGRPMYRLDVFKPSDRPAFVDALVAKLRARLDWPRLDRAELRRIIQESEQRPVLRVSRRPGSPSGEASAAVDLRRTGSGRYHLQVRADQPGDAELTAAMVRIEAEPLLAGVEPGALRDALAETVRRPFFLLFLFLFFATALLAVILRERLQAGAPAAGRYVPWLAVAAMLGSIWLLPGLTLFARILCSCIYLTILSVFRMDLADTARFGDHFRFLLMIFIYSGFWVLYFQMFDSVLWYVKAYVDAAPLDGLVNSALAALGVAWRWRFDVEHVTVINAGTIIVLQLVVSKLFEKRAALPTMITGIVLGTAGFAILAVSPHIWVFVLGNIVFSLGEMTAHPKFFSYVGQIAPRAHVAMYMGYLSLYGVIGSSIAGVLGANLYVRFVDRMNQPRLLWLIFAGIGAATVVGLLLYHKFLNPHREAPDDRGTA